MENRERKEEHKKIADSDHPVAEGAHVAAENICKAVKDKKKGRADLKKKQRAFSFCGKSIGNKNKKCHHAANSD